MGGNPNLSHRYRRDQMAREYFYVFEISLSEVRPFLEAGIPERTL